MRPGFTVGGVVISQRVPVSELAVRDVIVFHNPNKPSEEMVHRIVQMTKGPDGQLLIKTQGDANPVRDPWTLTIRGNSVYKVRWSLPLLGYVAVAYQNHRGIALLVAGFLLILVALSIVIRQRRNAKAPPARADALEPSIE
jgi:signal peptidase